MDKYEEYNNTESALRYWFLGSLFVLNVVLIWVLGWSNIFYPLIITLIILQFKPWTYRITDVTLNSEVVTITRSNILTDKRSYSFESNKVDFIYRDRPITLRRGITFNGNNRGNVLTLFFEGHPLFDLTPNQGGWSDQSINKLAQYLKHNGLKQVVDKYGESDVLL